MAVVVDASATHDDKHTTLFAAFRVAAAKDGKVVEAAETREAGEEEPDRVASERGERGKRGRGIAAASGAIADGGTHD